METRNDLRNIPSEKSDLLARGLPGGLVWSRMGGSLLRILFPLLCHGRVPNPSTRLSRFGHMRVRSVELDRVRNHELDVRPNLVERFVFACLHALLDGPKITRVFAVDHLEIMRDTKLDGVDRLPEVETTGKQGDESKRCAGLGIEPVNPPFVIVHVV